MKITHGYFIAMGGFRLFEGFMPLHILDHKSVTKLTQEKVVDPPIETDIEDKNKAEGLTRTLVFVQTVWFVVQCIVRATESLYIET